MYFAVAPLHPDLPERISAEWARLQARSDETPIHCYALVDGSFDPERLAAPPWRSGIACALYDDTRLASVRDVGPHLVRLCDPVGRRGHRLRQLLEACSGKPLPSILFSALNAESLRAHFRPYLLARTPDSLEWPVRWADSRVLPALIEALAPDERQHLLAPLHAWLAVDRRGELIRWEGGTHLTVEAAGFDCWPLDDARFGKLVAEAEADAVLSHLDDTQPDVLTLHSPSENHSRVQQQLLIASRNGIEGAPARTHFSLLALCLHDNFLTHPAMQRLLDHTRRGADYFTQIEALPQGFWQQSNRSS